MIRNLELNRLIAYLMFDFYLVFIIIKDKSYTLFMDNNKEVIYFLIQKNILNLIHLMV